MPLGILDGADIEILRRPLAAGDRIFLFSDGISQSPEDALWLSELLSAHGDEQAEVMAERILLAARGRGGPSDDMTAAIIDVEKA